MIPVRRPAAADPFAERNPSLTETQHRGRRFNIIGYKSPWRGVARARAVCAGLQGLALYWLVIPE